VWYMEVVLVKSSQVKSSQVKSSQVKSSQVYTETTDNHTAAYRKAKKGRKAYRMCSGSQKWRTGVDGDLAKGMSIMHQEVTRHKC
jgi:hypothetical protein